MKEENRQKAIEHIVEEMKTLILFIPKVTCDYYPNDYVGETLEQFLEALKKLALEKGE